MLDSLGGGEKFTSYRSNSTPSESERARKEGNRKERRKEKKEEEEERERQQVRSPRNAELKKNLRSHLQ